VDPSQLPQTEDPETGLTVPTVLVQLRQSLIKHGGLETEGIFRVGGAESQLKDIKFMLNTKCFVDSDDVHCCASLIKRWYGEIPTRLFSTLPLLQIEAALDDINECMKLLDILPIKERTLYYWLLDLFTRTAQYQDINKMSPENLAICVAPQMIETRSIDNPKEALMVSQKVATFIKNTIFFRLSELEGPPELEPTEGAYTDFDFTVN